MTNRTDYPLTIVLTLCLVAGLVGAVEAQGMGPGAGKRWKTLADIPSPQFGCGGAVVNGKFHVLGGVTDKAGASNAHQVYDPATNSWGKKAPIPNKSGWPGVAVYRGKIYVFGGDDKGVCLHETDKAWVYDPAADSWSALASLPAVRSYSAAATVGDFIYVFGGKISRCEVADLTTYRYDPAANTYERMADLPEGAIFITQAYYNGNIYAIHGETARRRMADGVLKYEVAKDTWTKLNIPKIQKRRWVLTQQSSHVVIGSKLVVLGGMPLKGPRSDRATYFDMKTERFGQLDPLPVGRCCAAAGVIDGRIYVAGGFWIRTGDVSTCTETWGYPFPN